MHAPAVSLKLRKLRRRFGITAPRVVVRTHWPWHWQLLAAVLAICLVLSLAWLFMQRNEVGVIGGELAELRRQFDVQREELAALRAMAGTGQNAVAMERAAQQQLLGKVDALERENAALKEDIRVFEHLVPAAAGASQLRLESFRLSPDGAGRYRYRLLMAFQPDKQGVDFRGRLQLLAVYELGGKEFQLLLPDAKAAGAEYQLEIRHFLRREGSIELPPGAVLKSVEARILQGDIVKARRSTQL